MRDDLPHAMRETARRLEPDVVRLTAGGVSRGARMRRVQRAGQVAGSAVAVAAVFAGVALFGPQRAEQGGSVGGGLNQPAVSGAGSASGTGLPGTQTTTSSVPSTPTPTNVTPSPAGPAVVSDTELVSALKSCLSGTGFTGTDFSGVGSEHASTDTTVARSLLEVNAWTSTERENGYLHIVFAGPHDPLPKPGSPQQLPDQSVVYTSQLQQSLSDSKHIVDDLQVTLVRPDGTGLVALETVELAPAGAAGYGPSLIIPGRELVTMLDSPVWDAALAAAAAR